MGHHSNSGSHDPRRKRAKVADGQEEDRHEGIFPFLDLDNALVESVVRALSKAKAPKASDLKHESEEGRDEKEKEDEGKKEDKPPRNLNSLLAVSPSVARLALASSAEWRVDLEGLAYVAWCLGVKARDDAASEKEGRGTTPGEQVEEEARKTGISIPPGHLILDHAEPGCMDAPAAEALPTCRLLSDMASQGLIRGLELCGYWGNGIFPGGWDSLAYPIDISCFKEPWARFLSDVAPLLTRLDVGSCSDEDGPSDAHLAPLISSPASFPRLQCVRLQYVTDRFDERDFSVASDRVGQWCSVETLLRLAALPSLRDVSFEFEESQSARMWTDEDFGFNEHVAILVNTAMKILSDPRATESPVLMRAALDLARKAAAYLGSASCEWVYEFGTSLNRMGPMLQRILSLLLRRPPPHWTSYAHAVIQSRAINLLESMAAEYNDYGQLDDRRGPQRECTHGGLPFAFGVDLQKSGELSTLVGLALPAESDAAVAAALSEGFVDTGTPGESPQELTQRVPLKAARLLSKLYSATERCLWDIDDLEMFMDDEGHAYVLTSESEEATLAAFYDALFDFDRPENQARATQFFMDLNEPAPIKTCPVGPFVAALAQRVRESNLLQDLGGAEASGSGHVDPSHIPEWFRAATRSLRALRLGSHAAVERPRARSAYPFKADDASVLLNLLSIPGLDLSEAERTTMPRISVLLSRVFDKPRASAKAQTLALDILRAFGRHADLIYNSDSVFWPVEDTEQAAGTRDVSYVLPSLAVTFILKPNLVHDDRLWPVIQIAQGEGMKFMGDGSAHLRPVPFTRFDRLFSVALNDTFSLEARSAALVFSALCVSISFRTERETRQQRTDWTDSPSLRALYREWAPSIKDLPRVPNLKHLSVSSKLPSAYFEALFSSLPNLLSLLAHGDALRAELGLGLDGLGLLVSSAVASTPVGQAIPTGPFTAAELVTRLAGWATLGEGVRVCYGDSVAIAATLALERLMHDEACGKVLFEAPYPLLGRFLLAIGPFVAANSGHVSHPLTAALVGAARCDPSGIFAVLKDTRLCSNPEWIDPGNRYACPPPLFGHFLWRELDSPAILEITAMFLRHWLSMRPPVRALRSVLGVQSQAPPREIAALERFLGARLAQSARKLLSLGLAAGAGPAAGELLLGSMAAHILRALVLATEGQEQIDLLKRVAPFLQDTPTALYAAAGRGKGKGGSDSEDILAPVLAKLEQAIGMGPPGLAARLDLQ